MRWVVAAAFALRALSLLPGVARADPEDDGPYAATAETDTLQVGPSQVRAVVCVPDAPGPRPALALATNTTDGTAALATWCVHLATQGFVVAVPDPGYLNTDAASVGQTLQGALAFLIQESGRRGSRFFGRVDPLHRGVMGVGTGALGALWAASQDDTLSAAILLDPTDLQGQGREAAPSVRHVPVLIVNADPGACNGDDSSLGISAALSGPRSTVHVMYASACDAEWPASQTCQAACGASHDYAAQYVRRLASAYAGFFVGCDQSLQPHVTGAALQTLVADRLVDGVDQRALPTSCGPYAKPDAGPPDGGPAAASGCGAAPSSSTPWAPWLAVAALLALARWRAGG